LSSGRDESNNNANPSCARKNLAIAATPQCMNGSNTYRPPRTTPTIKQLKEERKKSHNLKVNGTKPQLLERL
jgi:hypothetical protein